MTKSKDVKDEESQVKMSEIDLNILIKFIGTFDGSRDALSPFLNNCRNAINLASSSQTDILLKYILSRLQGKAETACAVKEFTKWQQLEEFLKTQFGDVKHYSYLLSDLQECKQGRNESVSQYSLRIESCLAKLLTEINISIPTKKKDELAGRVAAMQDLALNTFTIGLHPQLSTVVRCKDPNTLNEAINFASAEEKILGISNRKHQVSSSNANQQTQYRQNSFNSRSQNQPWNQPGPSNSNFRPQGQPWNQPGPSNSNVLVCRYCKNIGHSIENCRKRQFNNNRRNQNFNFNPRSVNPNFNNSNNRPVHNVNHRDASSAHYDENYHTVYNAPSYPIHNQNENNPANPLNE